MSRRSLQHRLVQRRAARRPAPDPPPPGDPGIDPIERIDALTATGRTNWFLLLGYLTFALITTLGVEDIDFFVDSRQTQLPLVNVSIPTFSFFVFAPILGAALYAYLHLHIRKVAEALAETPAGPPRLEERIKPWLLNDFILRRRPDRDAAIRRRPMEWLAGLTTWFLVWAMGPLVLGMMWARTWPAHELWLSLLCALCLMASVYAGALSWTAMRQALGLWRGRVTVRMTVLCALLCLPVAWLTTANSKGIGEYVIKLPEDSEAPRTAIQRVEAWARDKAPDPDAAPLDRAGLLAWFFVTGLAELDAPDLTAARLSVLPPDEADLDTARHRYRKGFCERRGIDAEICDRAPSASYEPPAHLAQQRRDWCDARGYVEGDDDRDCLQFFARVEAEFDQEWPTYRTALIASVAKPDLRGKDLRRAGLSGAELTGVDFREARMEGADLRQARMEGAKLSRAWMKGADLRRARMEGANLRGADLQSVEWASGTNIAALAGSTDFRASATLTQDRLSAMVGNAATLLPNTGDPETGAPLFIPSCWDGEPEGWAILTQNFAPYGAPENYMRAVFLCSPTRPLCKTGTPWPADAPWPEDSELREPYDCVAVD